MNERIKQLSIEAGFPEWSNHAIEFELEKFAELIVQECIDEIKKLRHKYETGSGIEPVENDYYEDAFLQAEVKLKEHFGVE